jgi:ubiquinone/menaquinone biosynthesis C-methylase UbiE
VESLHQRFQDRGQSADVEATFRWLDQADGHPQLQEIKRRMLDLCPVHAADQVLDVGCGLGHEARRLAERVGPQGRVVGVDQIPAMIAEARRRVTDQDIPIAYEVGDAHQLALSDNTFSLCRTERVLRYLRNPEVALQEMARVVQPGGSVLAFDFDSDLTVVDVPDRLLVRRIADVLDAAVPHPWIGRQLFGLFRRIGLVDVRVVPHVVCLSGACGFGMYRRLNEGTIARAAAADQIIAAEAAAWWEGSERAAAAETFFAANLGFIVAGRKP